MIFDWLCCKKEQRRRVESAAKRLLGPTFGKNNHAPEERQVSVLISRVTDILGQTDGSFNRLFEIQRLHLQAIEHAIQEEGGEIHCLDHEKIVCLFDAWESLPNSFDIAVKVAIAARDIFSEIGKNTQEISGTELVIGLHKSLLLKAILKGRIRTEAVVFGSAIFVADKLSQCGIPGIYIMEECAAIAEIPPNVRSRQDFKIIKR